MRRSSTVARMAAGSTYRFLSQRLKECNKTLELANSGFCVESSTEKRPRVFFLKSTFAVKVVDQQRTCASVSLCCVAAVSLVLCMCECMCVAVLYRCASRCIDVLYVAVSLRGVSRYRCAGVQRCTFAVRRCIVSLRHSFACTCLCTAALLLYR